MKITVQFEMKGNDVRLLSEIRDPVEIRAGDISVKGLVVPKEWKSWNEVSCEVFESQQEHLITIPVKSLRVSRDFSDEIQVVYGIGDSRPVYITQAERRRYRDLEGLRDYRATLTKCMTENAFYDEDFGEYQMCGHGPEEHREDGCHATVDWYEGSRIYCNCECYRKPAPLMRIV